METLEQFVAKSGGRAKAAVLIGVAETTLWRWLKGLARPRGLAVVRLTELGVKTGGAGPARPARGLATIASVRPAAEAFAKNDEEMALGMLAMSPASRVADADELRLRLWRIGHGGAKPPRMARIARTYRRPDAGR